MYLFLIVENIVGITFRLFLYGIAYPKLMNANYSVKMTMATVNPNTLLSHIHTNISHEHWPVP